MKTYAFVFARGGSKGIKNKNLIKIGHKKLIDFTLDACKEFNNNFFTFVSTDSKIISEHCNKRGYQNSYLRPAYLSFDNSKIIDSVLHGLKWLKLKSKYIPDAVLLLQPTSPLRDIKQVKKAVKEFINKDQDSIVGVVKMMEHQRECIHQKNNRWSYLVKSRKNLSIRQHYEDEYYFIDGSFYLAKTEFLKKYKSFVVENKSSMYRFNQKYSIDIDDQADLKVARALIKN